MLSSMDAARQVLIDYSKSPAFVLCAYEIGYGYHRPGDEEEIAIFDTIEMAKAFVETCKRPEATVEDGWLRWFRKDTILYGFSNGGGISYEPAKPWFSYKGMPRNLSAEKPYPDGEPCMVPGHWTWCRCMKIPNVYCEPAIRGKDAEQFINRQRRNEIYLRRI